MTYGAGLDLAYHTLLSRAMGWCTGDALSCGSIQGHALDCSTGLALDYYGQPCMTLLSIALLELVCHALLNLALELMRFNALLAVDCYCFTMIGSALVY